MKDKFSNKVKEVLVSAGWYENRCIDISEVEVKLKSAGIEVFPTAREFLQEFNGLTIKIPDKATLYLDALEGLSWLQEDDNDSEAITCLDKLLGKSLCPIGWDGRSIHLISIDNENIFLFEWNSIIVCKDFEEAMERTVSSTFGISDFIDLTPAQRPQGYQN